MTDTEVILSKQILLITENIGNLSTTNPRITVPLDEPLNSQLYNELLSKGYDITTRSNKDTNDGVTVSTYSVNIALPTASVSVYSPTWYDEPVGWRSFPSFPTYTEMESYRGRRHRTAYNSYRSSHRNSYRYSYRSTN
jgi:hypothetical protein